MQTPSPGFPAAVQCTFSLIASLSLAYLVNRMRNHLPFLALDAAASKVLLVTFIISLFWGRAVPRGNARCPGDQPILRRS